MMKQDYYFKPDPPLTENELVSWAIIGMQNLMLDYIKVEEIDGQHALHFMGVREIQQVRDWLIKEGLKGGK